MQRKEHMNFRNWFWPLTGAVAVGFLAGACARDTSGGGQMRGGDPNGGTLQEAALESPALAQAPKGAPSNIGQLQNLSATYAAIAKKVTPAVVNISSERVVPGGDPLEDFFGGGGRRRAQGFGSGVIVDGRGIVVTNNHVVEGADQLTVTLNDRRRFPGRLLGTDPSADLAVLKVEADKPLPTVPWGDSDALQVGDIVLAIGSPFGILSSTVTQGIISAKERSGLGVNEVEDFLQTDAAINPGNSGGALVDVSGRLVGINSAILSKGGGNEGIGLAIPARLARKSSGQIVATGRATRGYLGIATEYMTDDIAREIGAPRGQGVLVLGVGRNAPAARLPWSREGNVILKVNGAPINSPRQFAVAVTEAAPGSKLALDVWQNGRTRTFEVTVGRRPDAFRS